MSKLFLTPTAMRKIGSLLLLMVGLLFLSHSLDNDIYFLLNHGRYVVEQGIPTTEPFTIHEGFSFLMQQWLAAVIFWEIYTLAGATGLVAITYVIGAALIASLYYLYRLMAEGNARVAYLLASAAGFIVCLLFICTRPQIFSTLLLVWEVIILELMVRRGRYRLVLALPVLSVLLVNLHAAMWQMMLVLLLPYVAEIVYDSYRARRLVSRRLLGALAIGAVLISIAGLANPYGVDAMTYVWRSYGYSSIAHIVGEMHPLSFGLWLNKIICLICVGTLLAYCRYGTQVRYLLLTLGIMYLAATAVRSVFLLLTIGIAPLAYSLRAVRWQVSAGRPGALLQALLLLNGGALLVYIYRHGLDVSLVESLPPGALVAIVLVALYLSASYLYHNWPHGRQEVLARLTMVVVALYLAAIGVALKSFGMAGASREPTPRLAAEYILADSRAPEVKVWTNYTCGNYLEFHHIPCYLDTRAEVFLPANNGQKDVLAEYLDLECGRLPYREFLARYDFDYILTTSRDIMHAYLATDPDYEMVLEYTADEYDDDDRLVQVRLYRPIEKNR